MLGNRHLFDLGTELFECFRSLPHSLVDHGLALRSFETLLDDRDLEVLRSVAEGFLTNAISRTSCGPHRACPRTALVG